MAKSLKNHLHAHGCKRCHVRYTDACAEPATDTLCTGCRGGKVWQYMVDSAAPHPCCENSRLVTAEERQRYALAGKRPWFICPACARTHPYDPIRRTP